MHAFRDTVDRLSAAYPDFISTSKETKEIAGSKVEVNYLKALVRVDENTLRANRNMLENMSNRIPMIPDCRIVNTWKNIQVKNPLAYYATQSLVDTHEVLKERGGFCPSLEDLSRTYKGGWMEDRVELKPFTTRTNLIKILTYQEVNIVIDQHRLNLYYDQFMPILQNFLSITQQVILADQSEQKSLYDLIPKVGDKFKIKCKTPNGSTVYSTTSGTITKSLERLRPFVEELSFEKCLDAHKLEEVLAFCKEKENNIDNPTADNIKISYVESKKPSEYMVSFREPVYDDFFDFSLFPRRLIFNDFFRRSPCFEIKRIGDGKGYDIPKYDVTFSLTSSTPQSCIDELLAKLQQAAPEKIEDANQVPAVN